MGKRENLSAFRVGCAYRLSRTALEDWIRERSRPENDAWGRELERLTTAMRAEAQAAGLTDENAETMIAEAVAHVRARRQHASSGGV
jgi:hypothetical protein